MLLMFDGSAFPHFLSPLFTHAHAHTSLSRKGNWICSVNMPEALLHNKEILEKEVKGKKKQKRGKSAIEPDKPNINYFAYSHTTLPLGTN